MQSSAKVQAYEKCSSTENHGTGIGVMAYLSTKAPTSYIFPTRKKRLLKSDTLATPTDQLHATTTAARTKLARLSKLTPELSCSQANNVRVNRH
jgi:hypothetical protein